MSKKNWRNVKNIKNISLSPVMYPHIQTTQDIIRTGSIQLFDTIY